MIEKLNSQDIAELERYLSPKGFVVEKLPAAKSVKDLTEVFVKTTEGKLNSFKMVEGNWVQIGSNLTTEIENTTPGSETGGSGIDYSGDIADNIADIATNAGNIAINAADIDAIELILHDYVETAIDYTLETAVGVNRKVLYIKNIHATDTLTVDCFGAETIDGETTQDFGADDCLAVMSNGSSWIII